MGDFEDDLKETGRKVEKGVDQAVEKAKEVGGKVVDKTGTDDLVRKGKAAGDKFFTKVEDVAGDSLDKIQDAGSSVADTIEDVAEKGADALKKDLKKI